MSTELCLQFIIEASETKSHVYSDRIRKAGIRSLFDARSYFRKKRDRHQQAETDTVIIFLPSNYRAPSCQCARLFHELTNTRKRRLNLRATISLAGKTSRLLDRNFRSRLYVAMCSEYIHVYVCTYIRNGASARPTNSKFTNRIINSSS